MEKDNVIVLRNIIEFSETEGVTSSAIKNTLQHVLRMTTIFYHVLHRRVNLSETTFTDLRSLILSRFIEAFSTQISTAVGNPIGFSNGYVAPIRAITESKSAQELL